MDEASTKQPLARRPSEHQGDRGLVPADTRRWLCPTPRGPSGHLTECTRCGARGRIRVIAVLGGQACSRRHAAIGTARPIPLAIPVV